MAESKFREIEEKWQRKWEEEKVFEVKEDANKKKYYVLEMFPYPSAEGLHVGHAFNYVIGDVYSRFKIMKRFNVLHPMGYDSLGLPAENAAIKVGIHPKEYTDKSIGNFMNQQKILGLSYDWNRKINTSEPDYYKWDQWIFLKMFEKGLVYKKKSATNWCPKCNTVLANEQVHNGKCEYHGDTNVEIKHLEQWYFKITEYIEELNDFSKLGGWPELIKKLQKNWIGKSHGSEIDFEINKEKWPIFTTRADTIYGVTFMVISAQHPRLMELVGKEQKKEIENFLKLLKSVSEKELEDMEKEGVFTGSYAVNPVTNDKVPVYAGNFVIADYGCGMVMAVPAHDQRDFEFAKKYKIKIKVVIEPQEYSLNAEKMSRAYTGDGILVNSEKFNGWNNKEAIEEITKFLEEKNVGRKCVQYKMRDWLVSRQRYWGTPIPIVYCGKCGVMPVPEKELPVHLPYDVKFGKGNPLATNEKFIQAKCPKCSGNARRETDTMDTFVNSSWYQLRYCDPKNDKKIFDHDKAGYWNPVDLYIGGKEHACMHLIYLRFYTKFLRDLGMINFSEPVVGLFNQGYIYGQDGRKMSKSLGNVINPLDVIEKYSVDSLRMALVSFASPDKDTNWDEKILTGSYKFLNKVFNYFENVKIGKSSPKIESKINRTIKEMSEDIESFRYNLGIIKIRALFDSFMQEKEIAKKDLEIFLRLLSPFCPHLTEEIWEKLGNKKFISLEKWPVCDEKKINDKFEKQEKILEKSAQDISYVINLIEEKQHKKIEKIYLYILPNELEIYDKELLEKRIERKIEIFAVNDKNKYDPEGKAGKAKPGRPGIYAE